MTELQDALTALAEHGEHAGAEAVVDRALETAHPKRRGARVVFALAASVAVLVAGGVAYVRTKTNDIDRVKINALAPPDVAGGAMNILVVGVDTRAGESEPTYMRADSIMVVRLTREFGVTSVLAMPRDLYLQDEATGAAERLSAHGADPEKLVREVAQATGLPIGHYARVEMQGFARIVDAVGGVTIYAPAPMRDELSGLALSAGCVRLNGEQALAYVRSRHLQMRDAEGKWHADPTGDLGRIQRQQALLMTGLRQLAASRDPRTLNRLLDVAADNALLDEDFPLGAVRDWAGHNVEDGRPIAALTFPSTPNQLANGAAVLEPLPSELPAVISAFNADPHASEAAPPGPCA